MFLCCFYCSLLPASCLYLIQCICKYIYDANYNNKNERDGKKSVQETDNQKYKKLYS